RDWSSDVCSSDLTPESPTAQPPSRLMRATISWLTLPTRTIRASCTVSASVTRSPSTNRGSMPNRRIHWLSCPPPPWTMTGWSPTYLRSTRSVINASWSAGSAIALPPYLMTKLLPAKDRMYGRASIRTPARFSRSSCLAVPPLAPVTAEAGAWPFSGISDGAPTAAPPLMNPLLPVNLLHLAAVLRVDPHVLVGQIAAEREALARPHAQVQANLDLEG